MNDLHKSIPNSDTKAFSDKISMKAAIKNHGMFKSNKLIEEKLNKETEM